jgi:hypothetical protein
MTRHKSCANPSRATCNEDHTLRDPQPNVPARDVTKNHCKKHVAYTAIACQDIAAVKAMTNFSWPGSMTCGRVRGSRDTSAMRTNKWTEWRMLMQKCSKLCHVTNNLMYHRRTSRICCLNELLCGWKHRLSATTRRATMPIKPTIMPGRM